MHRVILIVPLSKEDFYSTKNQHLFEAILRVVKRKEQIDVPNIGQALNAIGQFNTDVAVHLDKILDSSPISINSKKDSQKIKNYSLARKLALACMSALDKLETSDNPEQLIADIQKEIIDIQPEGTRVRVWPSISRLYTAAKSTSGQ